MSDDVWVAVRRRGSRYHRIVPADSDEPASFTACYRSTRTGETLTLDEVRDLAAMPCQRCYPPDIGRSFDGPMREDVERVVQELRQMAEWLTRPGVREALPPIGETVGVRLALYTDDGDDAAGIAVVDAVGAALGLPVRRSGGQHTVEVAFGRSVVSVTHIEAEEVRRYRAERSYRGLVDPE